MSSPPASTEFWAQTARARVLCSVCLPTPCGGRAGQILWDGTGHSEAGTQIPCQGGLYAPGAGLLPQMSAREFLFITWARSRACPGARKAEAERLLKAVDLWDVADRKLGQFSGGMRQRPCWRRPCWATQSCSSSTSRRRASIPGSASASAASSPDWPGAHRPAGHPCGDGRGMHRRPRPAHANKGKLLKADRPKTFIASIQTKGGGKASARRRRSSATSSSTASARCSSGRRGRCSPHRRRAARRVRPGGVRPEPEEVYLYYCT